MWYYWRNYLPKNTCCFFNISISNRKEDTVLLSLLIFKQMKTIPYILFLCLSLQGFSQCGTPISTFPYTESFESGTAGWTHGGIGDDWAWGVPNKSIIQAAGAGTKCWVTGGLNGSFYNYGERSYVVSPCFDFTNLSYPHVKMKIYWESENQYDGAVFQYSLNNGNTWNNVGNASSTIDCLNQNWYNQTNISGLNTLANPKHGWAGNSASSSGGCLGGSGSMGWVTAQQCMSNLSGQASVQFRFAFGSGTICNNFDGFAFDDITIGNAPPNYASYSFACTANPLEYQFTNTSPLCATLNQWDFGDPASGANNVSNNINPTHVFSSPGIYNVSLTVSGPCNATSTLIKNLITLNTSALGTNPTCSNSNSGSIIISTTGNFGLTTFTLQPNGITNNSGVFNSLGSNTYTITTSDANACSLSNIVTLTTPPAITWSNFLRTNITCNGLQNGSIQASATGGSGGMNYILNPGNISNSTGNYSPLNIGSYTITATDVNGCSIQTITSISQPNAITTGTFAVSNVKCNGGNDGQISASYLGGTGSFTYSINPTGISNSTGIFTGLSAITYTITGTDANGCSKTSSVTLTEPSKVTITNILITQPGCSPGNDGTATVSAIGGIGLLTYSMGGSFTNAAQFSSLTANTFTITVKDANGCTATSSITLQNPNGPQISSVQVTHALCFGDNNGSILCSATATAMPMSFTLTPSNSTNSTGLFSAMSAGNYVITVSDANLCTATTNASIYEPEKLVIDTFYTVFSPCGSNITEHAIAHATGGIAPYIYELEPNTTTNTTGYFSPVNAGVYTLTVTDNHACTARSILFVSEKICCENIFIPNVFSPNNDGKNDEFRIVNAAGIQLINFKIYNRWGNEVFRTLSLEDGWNGRYKGVDAEIGTYYYFIKYQCLSSGKEYSLQGDLLLLR